MAKPGTDAPFGLPSFEVCHDRWRFGWNRDDTKRKPGGFVIRQEGIVREKKIAEYPATTHGWQEAWGHAESLSAGLADAIRARINEEPEIVAGEALLKEISPIVTVPGAVFAGSYGYESRRWKTQTCDVYFTATEVLVVESRRRRVWVRAPYAELYPLEFHAANSAVWIPGPLGGAREFAVRSTTMLGIVGPGKGIFVEIAGRSPAETRIDLMHPARLILKSGASVHG